MELLLVRELDRACSVEELRSPVGGHILELGVVKLTAAALASISNTARARALFHRTTAVREDFAVEEGQVVRICTVEALVRVCIRLKLIDDVLRVLCSGEELICSLAARERLWASQVVYQLSAAARALMAFLKFFLHHVLGLRAASHTLTTLWLRPTYLSSAFTSSARHLLLIIVARLVRLLALAHLLELLLIREGV